MAVIPILMNIADELENSFYGYNDFAYGINPHEICRQSCRSSPRLRLVTIPVPAHPRHRKFPHSSLQKCDKHKSNRHVTKDGFQVSVDVQQFKPEEITVKTVDNYVVIEGKHEEREDDHGIISRHFIRRFSIPEGYDPKDVISTLSSDGLLTVKAPLPSQDQRKPEERIVQIQQTESSSDATRKGISGDNHQEMKNGTVDNSNNMEK